MNDESKAGPGMPLHAVTVELIEALVRDAGSRADVVRGDDGTWLEIEETSSKVTFIDAQGDQLRIVPFVGDRNVLSARPFVREIRPAWVDGELELAADISTVTSYADRGQLMDLMHAALDYWSRPTSTPPVEETAAASEDVGPAPETADIDLSEPVAEESSDVIDGSSASTVDAKLRADVSDQWSWASSVARIPQISDLTVSLSEPIEEAKISVRVSDADVEFGSVELPPQSMPAGASLLGSIHVPLSARVMSQVEERRGASCVITLEDAQSGRPLARYEEALDLQPRDLWIWDGDPRRTEQRERLVRRHDELVELVREEPDRADLDQIASEIMQLRHVVQGAIEGSGELSRSLLASFVRPNHPEVAMLAREAASLRGQIAEEASFHTFQLPERNPEEWHEVGASVDASVTAVYEALRGRNIAYSEPPPGWDYTREGQRIRDHGDVARGGLGTCMDTTVLTAAVLEHVGLHPVLVLIPSHIFIGYWRRDPAKSGQKDGSGSALVPDWYPRSPVLTDTALIQNLVEGGYLGVIETTCFTVGQSIPAAEARGEAQHVRLASALRANDVSLIDVLAARRAGVSPLPAVNERADGVTEVIEYRPGGVVPVVTEVAPTDRAGESQQRHVDLHPVRYRTWKASLFSLNATNALLNLGRNARVQPLVLPPEGLGTLEDKLNEDVSFHLHSGFDVPEVWRARDKGHALYMLESSDPGDQEELLRELRDRRLYVQRIGRVRGNEGALSPQTFVREIRSMAHQAKSARDERGMNPLFLCIGLLRWEYKPDVFADVPLILVPVNVAATRGRHEFTLSLDSSQQTTPNAALIEWLRREHGLTVPGLAEPLTDRAGIDVDAVLTEVRNALLTHPLPFRASVASEARLATLDLSAFRMWQDLNLHAEHFFTRPLVRHLVHTPTETFVDPVLVAADEGDIGDSTVDAMEDDELEKLETPIPADSTQKRAVLWAREGRTFVLQGPPGTGKSQTITNMVAESLLAGLRVLFVAEKGTALAVVQRRLEAIGLGPFTLNLHHEGSNAAEVRAQLKRALTATVDADSLAMESARRLLRNARFELTQYPEHLHNPNAAGLSAYGAHDELLVLQDGPEMPIPTNLVAHQAEQIEALKALFEGLQRWTSAAGVRVDHPWRLAGSGSGDPFDVDLVSVAVRGVLDGLTWTSGLAGTLREAVDSITHLGQLDVLAMAANPTLPSGDELAGVLDPAWPTRAADTVVGCEQAVAGWSQKLHGFAPDVISLDLRTVAGRLETANASGFMGRKGRQLAVIEPLNAFAPAGLELGPSSAGAILVDLIAAQDAGEQIRRSLGSTPGLARTVPVNPFVPGALGDARDRLTELTQATAGLRDAGEWTHRVHELARNGQLVNHRDALTSYAAAWHQLWAELAIQDADFDAWLNGATLSARTRSVEDTWRREADYERLVPLQRWCHLVRKLEPMRTAGLDDARVQLLEGKLPADTAEDALARGVARASLTERIGAEGLDRFDAVAHDQRVTAYSKAQADVREQWVTDGPARLLAARGGGGLGSRTGGLARELEKTTKKLGTRPILRKYGEAVQELTPLVLCSPSSVVDLIEPGVMEFDLVVFDEASQITVPEAVGALGRARAAIVVGDSKQMPPTRRVGGGSGDDEEIDDPDAEEIVEDQESILSECELARVPTLSLNWHYRSQDEALIAFSNRTYYRGDLSSFPTPTLLSSETGLEFRPVHFPENDDKGMYLRAGSERVDLGNGIVAGTNTNPFEARAIVEYIHDLVRVSSNLPSAGIVTFNEQQRQLIEDLLHASSDSRVADVLDESKMGRGEALFIKALEQVQGDERDIVIFSIAFSKQANGKVPTNFGPLSNAGGERRLNVAVTRARRKNVVFCSFNPASNELDVSGSTYQGPKDLKQFLIDAQAAGSQGEDTEPAHRIAIRDRHRDDIATALRDAGLQVMSDVGLSNFRLDLVLAKQENPELPILPVLLDGESWRKRTTVSDRDVLPVEVLENLMGWPTVARIWWPMWLQNRDEVIRRILSEVDLAAARLESEPLTVAPAGDEIGASTQPEVMTEASARPSAPRAYPDEDQAPAAALAASMPPAAQLTPTEEVSAPRPGSHASRTEYDSIAQFVPAHTNVVGTKDVLDRLPDRGAADVVREQVLDVIEAEGPVELGRLARIVGRRFGLSTVRAARVDEIVKLVPREQVSRSRRLGDFAWPEGMDPETWRGFRIIGTAGPRALEEVAPQEIANAMQAVLDEYPDLEYVDEVLRPTAELFGIVRLGANVRSRLEEIYESLQAPTRTTTDGAD